MEAQDDYFVNLFTPLYKILSEIGGYKLSDIDELYDLPDASYDSLKIFYYNITAGSSISLRIASYMSYLNCSYKPDLNLPTPLLIKGVFESIKEKLERKEIRPTFFRKFLDKSYLIGFPSGALIALGQYLEIVSIAIIGLCLFLYSILSIILCNRLVKETSFIIEKIFIENESFFRKYKEKIILILITSVISMIFGIFSTLLVQLIKSP